MHDRGADAGLVPELATGHRQRRAVLRTDGVHQPAHRVGRHRRRPPVAQRAGGAERGQQAGDRPTGRTSEPERVVDEAGDRRRRRRRGDRRRRRRRPARRAAARRRSSAKSSVARAAPGARTTRRATRRGASAAPSAPAPGVRGAATSAPYAGEDPPAVRAHRRGEIEDPDAGERSAARGRVRHPPPPATCAAPGAPRAAPMMNASIRRRASAAIAVGNVSKPCSDSGYTSRRAVVAGRRPPLVHEQRVVDQRVGRPDGEQRRRQRRRGRRTAARSPAPAAPRPSGPGTPATGRR